MLRAALVLFCLPLAAADRLDLADGAAYPGLPWFALVTGQIRGTCETRLIQGRGGENSAALGDFEARTVAGCQSRIVVFSANRAPTWIDSPSFTGGDDTISVSRRRAEPIDLQIWMVACRNEQGLPCSPNDRENFARYDARSDAEHAVYQYRFSTAGIEIQGKSIIDIHDTPEGKRLEAKREELDCGDFSLASLPAAQRAAAGNRLNIFYVTRSRGLGCPPAPESRDPLTKAGFVIVPVGRATEDLLSHEMGHVLLGDGEHHTDPTNVMSNDKPLMRCNFDLDQAYRIHRIRNYRSFRAEAVPTPDALSEAALCQTEDCRAAARLYPFACPQEMMRALTDWVRCLHCPAGRPPKIAMPDNASRFVPPVKMMLGGQLRVADRAMIDSEVKQRAAWIAGRVKAFPRERFAGLYRKDMLENVQFRAAEVLQQLDKPCDVKSAAMAALEWALTNPLGEEPGPRVLPERVRMKAAEALGVHKDLAGNCAAP